MKGSQIDSQAHTENEELLNADTVDNIDRDLDEQDDGGDHDHIRAKFMSKGSTSLATESSKSKNRPSNSSIAKLQAQDSKSKLNETIIEEIRG